MRLQLHFHNVLICLEQSAADLHHQLKGKLAFFQSNHDLVKVLHVPDRQLLQIRLARQQLLVYLLKALGHQIGKPGALRFEITDLSTAQTGQCR